MNEMSNYLRDIDERRTLGEKVSLIERARETGEPIQAWPEMRASDMEPVRFVGWSGQHGDGEAFAFDGKCLCGEKIEVWSDAFVDSEDLMPADCQSGFTILEYREHSVVIALTENDVRASVWISGVRYRTDETFRHVLALNLCGEFDVCIYRLTDDGGRELLYERDFCCK